jgi:hypothetical protein
VYAQADQCAAELAEHSDAASGLNLDAAQQPVTLIDESNGRTFHGGSD